MTYLAFHLFFTLPALLIAFYFGRKNLSGGHVKVILGTALIATLAAAPWDNWAVKVGIWDFSWDRVTPVIFFAFNREWKLPAEEYAFFGLLAIVVTLLCTAFLPGDKYAEEQKKAKKEERYHY